jgi:hypothetical protein
MFQSDDLAIAGLGRVTTRISLQPLSQRNEIGVLTNWVPNGNICL